jgi:hypothetical protein
MCVLGIQYSFNVSLQRCSKLPSLWLIFMRRYVSRNILLLLLLLLLLLIPTAIGLMPSGSVT